MSFRLLKRLDSTDNFNGNLSIVSFLIILPFFIIVAKYPLNFQWNEIPLIFAFDAFLFVIMSKIKFTNKPVIHSDAFYPVLNPSKVRSLSEDGLSSLMCEMVAFPKIHARSIFLSVFIPKVVLCYFFMIKYPNVISPLREAVLLLLFMLLILVYRYLCIYLETQHKISVMLSKLSDIRPLPKVDLYTASKKARYWRTEISSFSLIWILLTFVAIAMEILVVSENEISPTDTNIIVLMSVGGLALFLRVLLLSRTLQERERNHLIEVIKKTNLQGGFPACHPSSDPAIVEIANALSEMQETINGHEKRISNWAIQAVESSRYQGLGEIAALVCHDLTNPLWLAKIALDHLKNNPENNSEALLDTQNDAFIMTNILEENLQKSLGLVSSLRSYLKASNIKETSSLLEGMEATVRILRTKYKIEDLFSQVNIALPGNLSSLEVDLSKHDVIHIFLNIISNSFDNIMENKITTPRIKVTVVDSDSTSDYIEIDISDNGTGLLPEQFESMTNSQSYGNDPVTNKNHSSKVSMGLKLVRRLLERNGGEMSVKATNPEGFRTTVRLMFPKAKQDELKMIA